MKKECPSCAMEIDNSAKVCPICGYEFSDQAPGVKWIAILLVLLAIWFLMKQIL